MLVRVHTCQNTTLLELTCQGFYTCSKLNLYVPLMTLIRFQLNLTCRSGSGVEARTRGPSVSSQALYNCAQE